MEITFNAGYGDSMTFVDKFGSWPIDKHALGGFVNALRQGRPYYVALACDRVLVHRAAEFSLYYKGDLQYVVGFEISDLEDVAAYCESFLNRKTDGLTIVGEEY